MKLHRFVKCALKKKKIILRRAGQETLNHNTENENIELKLYSLSRNGFIMFFVIFIFP